MFCFYIYVLIWRNVSDVSIPVFCLSFYSVSCFPLMLRKYFQSVVSVCKPKHQGICDVCVHLLVHFHGKQLID
jgi:hypothetical protein